MGNGKSSKNRLRVRRMVDVPLREVSGICLRRGRNGRMFLIAVGDRVAKIAWFCQPRSDEGRIDWHTSNIAKLSGSMLRLAFTAQGRAIVGLDTRKPRRNLVLLEPPVAPPRGRGQSLS